MAPAAGERIGWLLCIALAVAVAVAPVGCDPDDEDPLAGPIDAALRDVGPEVVLPTLIRFRDAASSLSVAAHAWDDAASDRDVAREAARDAWFAAMAAWQELEVQQIGPAASSLTAVAGEDLRDAIYSWPTTNPCRVDQETAIGGFDAPDWFDTHLVNTYGLDAIEHLAFAGDANACPPQVPPNQDGAWDTLGSAGVDARRAEYAVLLAEHVLVSADTLVAAWSPDGGDVSGQLAAGGDGASPWGSDAAALQAVFDALFYLEVRTKDDKLAAPLGLQSCAEAPCPELAESPESGASDQWIAANLVGFRALFTGGDGDGLDDVLTAAGHGDVVGALLADLDNAIAIAEALEAPIQTLVVDQPNDVLELHDAVKRVTDSLKGDIAITLTLRIPDEASGDND